MLTLDSRITWRGWSTTLLLLQHEGWEAVQKSHFTRSKTSNRLWHDKNFVYLFHMKDCMLARLSVAAGEYQPNDRGDDGQHYRLDFLINKKQHHQRMLHVTQALWEMSEEDIPALYEMILGLQKDYPKRALPEAEIIKLSEAA